MPSAYSLSPRFCPRSSTTTESDVRVAISFAIVKPAHPPPTITTSTGFSRVIAALTPDLLLDAPILDLDGGQAPIRRIHRDRMHVIEFCWNYVPQTQPSECHRSGPNPGAQVHKGPSFYLAISCLFGSVHSTSNRSRW